MSGGFTRSAFRLPHSAATAAPVVLATVMLSGCALFRAPQAPAPITEAVAVPVEPPGPPPAPPVVASEPAPAPPPVVAAPKKPHREVEHPHPVKPPPPAPPKPPAPPPLITTRTIAPGDVHALLDSDVKRRNGKVIGRAVDMIADAAGKPRAMIVNLQGFMGIGDRKVSFPWGLFHFTPGDKNEPIVLDLPGGKLPAADRPKKIPLTGTRHDEATPDSTPIVDTDVERSNGSKVGRVVDVLIGRDAQPQAVVVDVGGLVGPGRRAIAANWSALKFAPKNKSLHALLDMSPAQVAASPLYERGKPIVAVSPAAPAATQPAGERR